MDILNITHNALSKYFKILTNAGYKSYNEVNNLLALIFIYDLINDYSKHITKEDYQEIGKALNCLKGSCLIPYF